MYMTTATLEYFMKVLIGNKLDAFNIFGVTLFNTILEKLD